MNKEQLHNIRKQVSDLFYFTFDALDSSQRAAFQNILINLDYQINKGDF
jgi:hypothetical protein